MHQEFRIAATSLFFFSFDEGSLDFYHAPRVTNANIVEKRPFELYSSNFEQQLRHDIQLVLSFCCYPNLVSEKDAGTTTNDRTNTVESRAKGKSVRLARFALGLEEAISVVLLFPNRYTNENARGRNLRMLAHDGVRKGRILNFRNVL
jgi:hypothetical protein